MVANETYCTPQATRMEGNLPFTQRQGVHAADDVVLTATGPGAELFKGRVDNTYVFKVMAIALGLGQLPQPGEQAARSQAKLRHSAWRCCARAQHLARFGAGPR